MRRLTSLLLLTLVAFVALPQFDGSSAPAAGREYPAARPAFAQSALPALPAGWPATLQLGMSSGRGDAAFKQ